MLVIVCFPTKELDFFSLTVDMNMNFMAHKIRVFA